MNRRSFLPTAATLGLAGPYLLAASSRPRRVAVIGHTGRGNYGHGLDKVWLKIPGAEIVGVADADPKGLERERKKLNGPRGFASYREMLSETRPEFVSVAPRHADQHRDMILAAIEAGVRGIYTEKPFCRTPAEADEIIAAAERSGTRIAVAHRNRYHPTLHLLREMLADGKFGRVLEYRGRGKSDHRGGAEDLWVLGTHVMDLFNLFAGPAKSCSAVMMKTGRPVTREDVVANGSEGLGPLAGDELHARYRLADDSIAYFDSIANDGTKGAGFGLQIVCEKGIIVIHPDRTPVAHFVPGNPFQPTDTPRPWLPVTTAGIDQPEPDPARVAAVGTHVTAVQDLIAAVDTQQSPLCDARAGLVTVEMVCAVFESQRRNGEAVLLPLKERGNALTKL